MEADVDVISAPRSPGSALKACIVRIHAERRADPSAIDHTGYPYTDRRLFAQNFDLSYDGAVPADRALSRSLNVPAVKMLQQKYQRFYETLHNAASAHSTAAPIPMAEPHPSVVARVTMGISPGLYTSMAEPEPSDEEPRQTRSPISSSQLQISNSNTKPRNPQHSLRCHLDLVHLPGHAGSDAARRKACGNSSPLPKDRLENGHQFRLPATDGPSA